MHPVQLVPVQLVLVQLALVQLVVQRSSWCWHRLGCVVVQHGEVFSRVGERHDGGGRLRPRSTANDEPFRRMAGPRRRRDAIPHSMVGRFSMLFKYFVVKHDLKLEI